MGKIISLRTFSKIKILVVFVFLFLVVSSITLFKSNTLFLQKPYETSSIPTKGVSQGHSNEISKNKAEYSNVLNSVAELQEVKDFKKLLEDNNKSTLGIMITDYPDIGRPHFTVKVYESLADHDTVFNWYRVSVEGEVTRQVMSAIDKWDVVQAKTASLIPEPSPKTFVVEKVVPAQCPITQGKYDVDMQKKNDQIADIQQALNYANLEIGRLSGEVFRLQGRVNMINGY